MTAESHHSVEVLHGELIKANIKAIKLGPGFEDYIDEHQRKKKQELGVITPFGVPPIEPPNLFLGYKVNDSIPTTMRFLVLKRQLREAAVVVCRTITAASDYLNKLNFSRIVVDDAN